VQTGVGCPRSRRRCETLEQRSSEAELSQYLSDNYERASGGERAVGPLKPGFGLSGDVRGQLKPVTADDLSTRQAACCWGNTGVRWSTNCCCARFPSLLIQHCWQCYHCCHGHTNHSAAG
jgi:hypothetical protein